jgi:ring-1,2-phenylacetyl-CoA epoxidase subunit PaaE
VNRNSSVSDVALLTGRIDLDKMEALLATLVPASKIDEWLPCGPYAMLTAARAALLG